LNIFLYIFKESIIGIVSTDTIVLELIDKSIGYACIFSILESISVNFAFFLRGLNSQVFVVLILVIQYLVIQPFISFLSIKYFYCGVICIWWSCIIGELFTLVVLLIYFIFFIDIEKNCNEVIEQIKQQAEEFTKEYKEDSYDYKSVNEEGEVNENDKDNEEKNGLKED